MSKPRFCKVCGVPVKKYETYCALHKRKRLKPAYPYLKDFRIRQKEKAVSYLGGKCTICGVQEPCAFTTKRMMIRISQFQQTAIRRGIKLRKNWISVLFCVRIATWKYMLELLN